MRKVLILGAGCTKCRMLEVNVEKAVKRTGIRVDLEKSRNASDYLRYKVNLVPGLIIDGRLISSGRVPSVSEIIKCLSQN